MRILCTTLNINWSKEFARVATVSDRHLHHKFNFLFFCFGRISGKQSYLQSFPPRPPAHPFDAKHRQRQTQTQAIYLRWSKSEYMETKRLAFPRFYFVSSADLLDILSNGNQPELVAKHLTKLFDSMAKLSFEKDADGKLWQRTCLGGLSKSPKMTLPHLKIFMG